VKEPPGQRATGTTTGLILHGTEDRILDLESTLSGSRLFFSTACLSRTRAVHIKFERTFPDEVNEALISFLGHGGYEPLMELLVQF
jgi:hypothetical protein